MEIKINQALADLTDVEALDDHKKIFLAVVSEIYRYVDKDHYIFFDPHDLFVLIGIKHFDPSRSWTKKNHKWIFECFTLQYHDYHNIGFKPIYMNGKLGQAVAGPAKYVTEITDEDAIRMWWYLLGVFANRDVVSDWSLRERRTGYNAYLVDRSYIAEMNYRLVKREYNFDDTK